MLLTRQDLDIDLGPDELESARKDLLETRGLYLLRNQVVEATLSANPILKAVHDSVDASPIERYATSQHAFLD